MDKSENDSAIISNNDIMALLEAANFEAIKKGRDRYITAVIGSESNDATINEVAMMLVLQRLDGMDVIGVSNNGAIHIKDNVNVSHIGVHGELHFTLE